MRNSRGPDPIDTYIDPPPSCPIAMSEHNRRSGYWRYYELATKEENAHMIRTPIRLVLEHPCPRPKKGKRGRPSRSLQGEAGLSPAHHDGPTTTPTAAPWRTCRACGRPGTTSLSPTHMPWSGTPKPFPKSGWSIYRPRRPASAWRRWGTRPGPAGGRQQRHGDDRVRDGGEAQQEGARLRHDPLKDIQEVPHRRGPGAIHHTGRRRHAGQRQRLDQASDHAA